MTQTSTPNGPGRPKDPAKRQAILDAAKQLFISKGYDGSSMEAIAAEAGVSKLTVYSHFTDKETLFCEAVQAKCAETMPELFHQPPAGAALDTLLLGVARGFYRLINSAEAIALSRLMIAQGGQNPQLSQLFFDAGPQRVLTHLERLIAQAQQKGELRPGDARNAAEHFLTLAQGCLHFRLLIGCTSMPAAEESERHVREVVEIFLRAYRL